MADRITPFTMPKWGIEMEEGVIREWRAAEGDFVRNGQLFTVIETDKISNDVELEFDGLLRRRIGVEGEAYKVGALIAVFADADVPDADIDAYVKSFKAADASFLAEAPGETATAPAPRRGAILPPGLSISPKAAELAERLGVDLSALAAAGRRLSLQDVEQAAKAQGLLSEEAPAPATDNPAKIVKLSAMRRTIAKRLAEATRTAPHFYLRRTIGMDAVEARRRALKEKGATVSINDFLIAACAKALSETPDVNVHFVDDAIHQFEHVDIAVAVAVDGGLVTPVVRSSEKKSLVEIAAEVRDLAARAREGKLQQEEYKGGTFSLSNLGMYGVESFDAVLNLPMAAILAAGAIVDSPAPVRGFSRVMTVTLTCDHRAIDGALGGRFLEALKRTLEAPETLK